MKAILVRERKTLNTSISFDGDEYNHFYNPWHFHPDCELTLILKSYGQRQVGDCIENFGPGDLVLVGSNLPHVWKNDEIFFDEKMNMKAQAIAEHIGMNKNAFCRFFKKGTRKSLISVVNQVRIGKACQLLKETDMNVLPSGVYWYFPV